MKNAEIDNYDKMEAYEKEIAPIIAELKKACNINRIPMFVCVAPKSTKEETTFKSDILSPAQFDMNIANNYFSDYLNILNGFATTYFQAMGDQKSNEEYEDLVAIMKAGEAQMLEKGGSIDGGEE